MLPTSKQWCTVAPHINFKWNRVGQNHIYVCVWCIYSDFGREMIKYTAIHGAYIRLWSLKTVMVPNKPKQEPVWYRRMTVGMLHHKEEHSVVIIPVVDDVRRVHDGRRVLFCLHHEMHRALSLLPRNKKIQWWSYRGHTLGHQ